MNAFTYLQSPYRLARVHADFLCLVMQFVDQNVVNTKAYVGWLASSLSFVCFLSFRSCRLSQRSGMLFLIYLLPNICRAFLCRYKPKENQRKKEKQIGNHIPNAKLFSMHTVSFTFFILMHRHFCYKQRMLV